MPAPISVIVPTLNAQARLPECLIALGEGLQAGLIRDLVVSDGGSDDASIEIADDAGATIVRGAASRGGQLRRGIAAAKGDWLLIVHADTCLAPGWTQAVVPALRTPGAYHFRLAFDAHGAAPWLVAGWANLRSRVFGLPYGDQGLLIDRASYDACGGYKDIALMEDVALARVLRGQLRCLDVTAVTSAARYQNTGWLRRGARNLWTLTRYLFGVDPDQLARAYRR